MDIFCSDFFAIKTFYRYELLCPSCIKNTHHNSDSPNSALIFCDIFTKYAQFHRKNRAKYSHKNELIFWYILDSTSLLFSVDWRNLYEFFWIRIF